MQFSSSFQAALGTLQRKFSKSIAQHGMLHTAERCVTKPFGFAWQRLRSLTPAERQRQAAEAAFDREHHVDTLEETNLGWLAQIDSPNWQFDAGYSPAPAEPVLRLLRDLPIQHRDFVFVDMGSGKGRVLLLASHFPFIRVVGVEHSQYLHALAEANIAAYQSDERRCANVQSVCRDAAEFAIPTDPVVLFFHHPFAEPLFQRVISRIVTSVAATPRPVFIIYYDPRCEHLFPSAHFHECARHGRDFVVYEAVT